MAGADLRIFGDAAGLARAAAGAAGRVLAAAARAHGSASIALAGGNTPRDLYRRLALAHGADVPWRKVHVFWGDERDVPPDDPASNYRMARECLLDLVPIPPDHVHPMPAGAGDPAAAAAAYERTLRGRFSNAWPDFDLVLLGMGGDGHTASLFPEAETLTERRRWVVPAMAPPDVEPRGRLTLSLPAIAHGRALFVLVTGPDKAPALRRALNDPPGPECPASLLRTSAAPVVWWADAQAAARVVSSH